MRFVPFLPALIGAAVFCPVAHGTVRTFAMEGTVSYVNDPLHLLDWVHVGADRMVYVFSFDSDAVDSNPVPWSAEYDGLSASLRVEGFPSPLARR